MNAVELIIKKRNGKALSPDEIEFLVRSYTKRTIPDYQFSSFLMAAFLRGMNKRETSALTRSMLYSGKVIDLSSIPGPKIDKHSTGGVGDKTSLILAPIVAAAGVNVPMISGRGLGHSGGTLDKLETIPGFRTDLNLKQYQTVLRDKGAVLIGQTKDIAPADKRIYSLRDVTGTVEAIPLITGSIMSKKLAEGIDGLVLDVKTGNGAFMKKYSDAIALAESLIGTARSFKKKVAAFITDMNQPLGNYVGNWLEIVESVNVLQGEKVKDLLEVTLNLSGMMLVLANKCKTLEEGISLSQEMISSGAAFDKFVEIVEAQGGDSKHIKNLNKYKKAKHSEVVTAPKGGYIQKINTYEIGMAALELGAGRKTIADKIDPTAGIVFNKKIGSRVKKGEEICTLFTANKNAVDEVKMKIENAVSVGKEKPAEIKMIKKIIV